MKREESLRSSAELRALVAPLLERERTVPLLVVRLPEFSETAWRDGKRTARRLERETCAAFRRTARAVVRSGDLLAHDTDCDWFAVAMLAPARERTAFTALDARAALERIAAGISLATGRRVETGWQPLGTAAELEPFAAVVDRALERGARERERYAFLATVGHELRTPLTSIRGYIETLLDGGVDAATTRRFLKTARSEALRLGRLVDGMLDFSMLDLSPSPCGAHVSDVRQTLWAACEALAPIAAESGIELAVDAPLPLRARIDADACMHAVVNLVENALKYGRPGGCVRVSAMLHAPSIRIVVDDDGPGIAPAARARVFERCARGESVSHRPGRGIGLTIVRTIAERAGGSVWIEESPLGGARFVMEIFAVPNAERAEFV